ncbi:competence protein ComK [Lederbergia sp. NSJ-179]|uniref:Rok-like winged helix domain-containing protein n=1 Tax=Lederbergia sp. NSJ-179 TaxID=2931402 RepID=UPI001FCF8FFD|nr:competence protein ComK [Lederbergia sp. NSJ-179]MCJ7841174.1 competence protein ComK [Lederbergia sp. NSJ-179]
MFDERNALKVRLEQMNDVEKTILAEIHKERNYIFNRLRELDEQEAVEKTSSIPNNNRLSQTNDSKSSPASIPRIRKGRPSRRSKTTKLGEIVINILKEANAPVRGKELKEKIESTTDSHIANMTTFMNTIRESDPNIIKVGRGLYLYDQNTQEDTNQ